MEATRSVVRTLQARDVIDFCPQSDGAVVAVAAAAAAIITGFVGFAAAGGVTSS